ncbi:MAG TPA: hypothetical protein VIT92_10325 [Burkholderiaceae bacterium]
MTPKQWKTVAWFMACVCAVSLLSACVEKSADTIRAEKNAEARQVENAKAHEKRNR